MKQLGMSTKWRRILTWISCFDVGLAPRLEEELSMQSTKKETTTHIINILHNCLKLFAVYTGVILAENVTEYQSYYTPWHHNYTFSVLPSWWVWVVLHLQHQPSYAVLASPSVGNQSRAKGMYSLPGSTFFKTTHVTTTPQLHAWSCDLAGRFLKNEAGTTPSSTIKKSQGNT